MDQCLDAWLVQVTDVGGCLARFMTHCCGLGIDQTECIDHDLAFNRLDGIHNYSHSSTVQLLKALSTRDTRRRLLEEPYRPISIKT